MKKIYLNVACAGMDVHYKFSNVGCALHTISKFPFVILSPAQRSRRACPELAVALSVVEGIWHANNIKFPLYLA